MHGGGDKRVASSAALLPTAVVGVVVIVIALLASAGRSGTIVIQRVVEPASLTAGPRRRISLLTVTETSDRGAMTRFLLETSFGGPAAATVFAGSYLQTYLPADNTVYFVRVAALQSASNAYFARRFPGRHLVIATPPLYAGSWLAPGRRSFFAVQLSLHRYRLGGRTTIGGRSALTLIPVQLSIRFGPHSPAQMQLLRAYVSPHSYNPIKETADGRTVYLWREYRVLPATEANQRLLSLTAAHPTARVSMSARAYVRAIERLYGFPQ